MNNFPIEIFFSCRRQQNKVEVVHNCNPSDHCLSASKDECYLSTKRIQKCYCSTSSLPKSRENYSFCDDTHILDCCPICLEYKCYFSHKKPECNDVSKLCDVPNYQITHDKCLENRTKALHGIDCKSLYDNCKSNVSKLSMDSLNLQHDMKNSCYKTPYEDTRLKHYSPEKHKSDSICLSNSAPSLKDDPTTSM